MSRSVRVADALHEEGENIGLHRLALFTACCTAFLIFVGGLVTSTQSGLSVPDWPTTYGWNMFAFPPSKWVGGILYEHSHRLIASTVGFLTIVLAAWLAVRDPRRWMKGLGAAALGAAIAHGVLGGLTGILLAVAWSLNSSWRLTSFRVRSRHRRRPGLTRPASLLVALVVVQITLGALTVLSRRNIWINSLHVVCGALVLTTSLVLTLRTWRTKFATSAVGQLPHHDAVVGRKPDVTADPADVPAVTDAAA